MAETEDFREVVSLWLSLQTHSSLGWKFLIDFELDWTLESTRLRFIFTMKFLIINKFSVQIWYRQTEGTKTTG